MEGQCGVQCRDGCLALPVFRTPSPDRMGRPVMSVVSQLKRHESYAGGILVLMVCSRKSAGQEAYFEQTDRPLTGMRVARASSGPKTPRRKRGRIYGTGYLAVAIGRRKRERVGQVPDLAHRAVAQQHFDNVEPHLNAGLFEKLEVIERGLREAAAFTGVYSGGRTRPFLGRTGFDFHKHQAIGIAKDEVDFSTRRTKIGGEKFQARSAQVLFCGMLAQFAQPQMFRLAVTRQPCFDARPEVHSRDNSGCTGLSGAKLRR